MNIFLADLVHNCVLGDNQVSGGQDFVVPLNIGSIAAYAQAKCRSSLEIHLFKYPEELLNAVQKQKPDLIGFSNYVWNRDLNLKMGALIKKQYPEILTVMGGPSIRIDPEGIADFLRSTPFIDIYIMYEGEFIFSQLIDKFAQEGRSFLEKDSNLQGCAYLASDGKLIYHESNEECNVQELISPYLNGMMDEYLEKGLIPLFETNRGCPFKCTYCTWGITRLNKVRAFPLERVYKEMEYVAEKFSDIPAWIVADANFGLLKRDVEIAKKMRDIKNKTASLRKIIVWESKTANERNLEIAKILGNDIGDVLIAVQTLDSEAEKNIKRVNIDIREIADNIGRLHSEGACTFTHVLSGLPGESYEGHLATLRKCFELDFDYIQVFSTLLLPGSEMESRESREMFKLQTKYRLRNGGYGQYNGIKSIDCEEIIRSNSAISEEEMLSLRLIHWLIWFGWNHGFFKPILRYVYEEHKINPIDVMLAIAKSDKKKYPEVKNLFEKFFDDAEKEWFPSIETLQEHYLSPKMFNDLVKNGFSKVEFKYNAIMILENRLFGRLLDMISDIVNKRCPSSGADSIIDIIRKMKIEPDTYFNGNFEFDKKINVKADMAVYVKRLMSTKYKIKYGDSCLKLGKSAEEITKIKQYLVKCGYKNNKLYAVEKSLGVLPDAFIYDVCVAG
ncbi:MAG: hypothetical protein A2Y10_18850 [Planctomycetes bacterium GWF2_41_51]|nr:MAG: hypothetical protein A2Y10_18850 [Planctomycetes bacterium GWF2_41_51]HBG27363.1 hypothetical protein [Phycisphaerales bacterium]